MSAARTIAIRCLMLVAMPLAVVLTGVFVGAVVALQTLVSYLCAVFAPLSDGTPRVHTVSIDWKWTG